MNSADLLHKPIASLPVSERFKEAMDRQGIKTLDELVGMPLTDVVNLKWFTDEILDELSALLFQNKSLR
jgi:DNA-directed RNA polymerase alpha subunit